MSYGYEIKAKRCKIIHLENVGKVDTSRNDVYYASELKDRLSGLFRRLVDDGADLNRLAVVVKLPKRVREARRQLGI
jgi:hypothetical protein